jgi:lipopolysaccharide/colanic/teichoic acid biosynthesis glycosyltransferase
MPKRLLDVLIALLGLCVLAPVLIAIAMAVRFDSDGPAIFRQVRVGRGGRHFRILKFRTMVATHDHAPRLSLTATADARVTRVGRFLRAAKLDELPQLFNVLKGDMSLVGPRPEVPRYVELYPQAMREIILSVRPGMTDEASILFRDESILLAEAADAECCYVTVLLPRKLQLYEIYVRTRSMSGDLRIMARTLLAVLRWPA